MNKIKNIFIWTLIVLPIPSTDVSLEQLYFPVMSHRRDIFLSTLSVFLWTLFFPLFSFLFFILFFSFFFFHITSSRTFETLATSGKFYLFIEWKIQWEKNTHSHVPGWWEGEGVQNLGHSLLWWKRWQVPPTASVGLRDRGLNLRRVRETSGRNLLPATFPCS